MPKIFYPPVYYGAPEDVRTPRLFQFYSKGYVYGLSLLKYSDTSYVVVDAPTWEELQNTLRYYLGGHRYVVDDAEAALLTAAGYGDSLTDLPIIGGETYSDVYYDFYGLPSEPDTPIELHTPPVDGGVTDTPGDPVPDSDLGGYGSGAYGGAGYGS